MGRITNLIPLLADSHTFTCKKAFHPYERQKNRPKNRCFSSISRKASIIERSEGQSKPHSNGLIQLLQSMCQLPVLSVLGQELLMGAALDDAAVFEDHDGVGVSDRG